MVCLRNVSVDTLHKGDTEDDDDDDYDDDDDNNNNNNNICRKFQERLETIQRRYKTDAYSCSRAEYDCTHRHCQVASIVR
jgi:hypothetical protein